MGAFNISQDAALTVSLHRTVRTRALLAGNPLTAPLAADFDAWIADWKVVNAQEIDLRIQLTTALAVAAGIDDELDVLSDQTATALVVITDNDRDAALFSLYFKNQRPSDFKRPQLGAQLEAMRGWVPIMAESNQPVLVALGVRVAAKVAEADAAVAAVAAIEGEIRVFRMVGARYQLIDRLNGLRKSTQGKLDVMPHTHPELYLPVTFSALFFPPERSAPHAKDPDISDLRATLAEAQAQVESAQKALDAAIQAEAEEEAARQKRAADEKAYEEAKKELEQRTAELAALKARLDKS